MNKVEPFTEGENTLTQVLARNNGKGYVVITTPWQVPQPRIHGGNQRMKKRTRQVSLSRSDLLHSVTSIAARMATDK